ncbi:hypothetical protein BS47DRAFT_265318 [Hydnum rufescens UP504]|uniref:Uncharacterized protein n=1 Tax=Hydnum rufescens UP504 TaxID=1448309 RepID=A0A9P6AM79_9AGAM|nr:hypothetical protein BS47DRAFT_265318 [Hydnum rufescens UP504]
MSSSPFNLQALEAMPTPYPELEISDECGLLQGYNDPFPDILSPLSYASSSSPPPILALPQHQWSGDALSQYPDAKRARHNHTNELSTSVSEITHSPPKDCPKCGRPLRRSHSTGLYRCGKCGPRGTRRLHDNTVNREDGPSHWGPVRSPTHSNNGSEGSFSFTSLPPDVKHEPEPLEILPENYEPPELIIRGLVSPEEVCQLFEIFFDRMNDANTLDPTVHNIPSLLTRCPFLFTVICAIASSALPSRPDLYPVAISLAKAEASKALSVREKGPYTSPEAALALKLMARWARRSCPFVPVTV